MYNYFFMVVCLGGPNAFLSHRQKGCKMQCELNIDDDDDGEEEEEERVKGR